VWVCDSRQQLCATSALSPVQSDDSCFVFSGQQKIFSHVTHAARRPHRGSAVSWRNGLLCVCVCVFVFIHMYFTCIMQLLFVWFGVCSEIDIPISFCVATQSMWEKPAAALQACPLVSMKRSWNDVKRSVLQQENVAGSRGNRLEGCHHYPYLESIKRSAQFIYLKRSKVRGALRGRRPPTCGNWALEVPQKPTCESRMPRIVQL